MQNDPTPQTEIPIACDPSAIPAEQREEWVASGKQVYAAVQEIRELERGYAFRLPNDPAMLPRLAAYINGERLCCPFLRFELQVEAGRGPFWLQLTGGEGVKEYMRSVFAESELLDERVAQTARLKTDS